MKNSKRILSVKVKHILDDSPDTSYLGEYSNRSESEYAIDRAHSEDCASVSSEAKTAKIMLEHAACTIADIQKEVIYEENVTEWEALEDGYAELDNLAQEVIECDCNKHFSGREYRYFNSASVDSHNTPEENRKYARQDYERSEQLNAGNWYYIGIRAEAAVSVDGNNPQGGVTQTITSGGLWGIESDSGRDYLESVEKEELADLKTQLLALGFSKRAISTAFKSIEREDS